MVPAESGPKCFKLKSSWHRNKMLAFSLKHWKGRRGAGSEQGLPPPPPPAVYGRSNTSLPPTLPAGNAELLSKMLGGSGTCHIQHSPNTPTTGLRERGNDTSKSTGRSGRQKQQPDATCEGKNG